MNLRVSGGRKSTKYPDGVKIDAAEFPADWFKGLRDEQVELKAFLNVLLDEDFHCLRSPVEDED